MALKSTIFKADLDVADMDRSYYGSHALTLARHPSETDERMMVRVLAFALHAGETLEFGKGLSDVDEPALWAKDLTGAIDLWVEVGMPDERDLRKACGRSKEVALLAYGRTADLWWKQNGAALARLKNLNVISLPADATQALAALAQRTMRLQCTIQEGQVWLGNGDTTVLLEPQVLQAPE
jgi:uncharacterized protein YaeQ